jgi:hypothetical protein
MNALASFFLYSVIHPENPQGQKIGDKLTSVPQAQANQGSRQDFSFVDSGV